MKINVEWRGEADVIMLFSSHTNKWLPCTVGADGDVWLWKVHEMHGHSDSRHHAKQRALGVLEAVLQEFHPDLELIEVKE